MVPLVAITLIAFVSLVAIVLLKADMTYVVISFLLILIVAGAWAITICKRGGAK